MQFFLWICRAATAARRMIRGSPCGLPSPSGFTKRWPGFKGATMFNWFQSLLPKKGDFFGMFEAHAATVVAAANALGQLADGHSAPGEHLAEINRREHEADNII